MTTYVHYCSNTDPVCRECHRAFPLFVQWSSGAKTYMTYKSAKHFTDGIVFRSAGGKFAPQPVDPVDKIKAYLSITT